MLKVSETTYVRGVLIECRVHIHKPTLTTPLKLPPPLLLRLVPPLHPFDVLGLSSPF